MPLWVFSIDVLIRIVAFSTQQSVLQTAHEFQVLDNVYLINVLFQIAG